MGFTTYLAVTCLSALITPINALGSEAPDIQEPSVSQTEYLDKLEVAESNGSTTIRILDTNHKFSTGCLQFQDETFLTQGKKYGLVATSTKEAEPLIYNCELQKQLAHKMLLDGGESHWLNSVRKLQLGKYPK